MRTRSDIDAVAAFGMVRSVMRTEVASVEAGATLREAARALRAAGVGTLVIMDGADIVGVVSERDVAWSLAAGADADLDRVDAVMSKEPRYLTVADSLATALQVMVDAHVRHLPVVDDGELVGLVSMRDVAGALLG